MRAICWSIVYLTQIVATDTYISLMLQKWQDVFHMELPVHVDCSFRITADKGCNGLLSMIYMPNDAMKISKCMVHSIYHVSNSLEFSLLTSTILTSINAWMNYCGFSFNSFSICHSVLSFRPGQKDSSPVDWNKVLL